MARDQVEVVIAEDGDHVVLVRRRPVQHLQRGGAAIDEIAREPQDVLARREADARQQPLEGGEAALVFASGLGAGAASVF